MIWFIAGVVLAVITATARLVAQMKRHKVYWHSVCFTALTTLVFGGMIAIFPNIVASGNISAETVVTSKGLSALQDGSQTRGSFFLGSGFVDGQQVFSYYEKRGGAFYLKTTLARDAKVVESDGTPRVEHSCRQTTNIWISVFTKCWNNWDYTFYVPKGSVVTNYTLDAK